MAVNPTGWSTTEGSNTTVSAVSIAEGMQPSGVNNAMRAIMAGVKEYILANGGSITTGGSADAQTLTTGMSLSAYAAGQSWLFEAGYTNTGTATLNVDSIGAKTMAKNDGSQTALGAGDITAGAFYHAVYDSGADKIIITNIGQSSTFDGVFINEAAAAAADVAGDGQIWVKSDTPNTLMFTDDAGNDYTVGFLDEENQALSGGATVTVKDLGTQTSGTLTLDMGDRPMQKCVNNGAFTLAPGSTVGACILTVTNAASAGAITTSGWTVVSGSSFDTTNTNKFRCHCCVDDDGDSTLVVQAMQ